MEKPVICGQLKGVDDSENFVKISACRGRIKNAELQFLVGSNNVDSCSRDEHRSLPFPVQTEVFTSAGHGQSRRALLIWINHSV